MRILQLHLFCAVVVPLSSCECQEYSHRGSGYSVKGKPIDKLLLLSCLGTSLFKFCTASFHFKKAHD